MGVCWRRVTNRMHRRYITRLPVIIFPYAHFFFFLTTLIITMRTAELKHVDLIPLN